MVKWWQRFSERTLVAHVLRAVERFNLRGGAQLSAAIAYFSVLSLVPILMLAFSVLGLILTVFQPDLVVALKEWIEAQFAGVSDDATLQQILDVIENYLANWATLGLAGIAVGFWFGSSWFGNLKRAVRLLMREDVDNPGKLLPLPLDVLANFAGLVALLLGIALTFGASFAATWLTDQIGSALGLSSGFGWSLALRLISLAVGFAAGTGMFWLLYTWFTPHPISPAHLWVGAGTGAASLLVLQLVAGYVVQAFSRNVTATVFGSLIVLMLFLNLFATLVLFIAAWLATQAQPADPEPDPEPTGEPEPVERRPGELYVSSKVAEKSMGVGLGTGYVVGTATGLGLGALLVAGLKALFGRRQ